MNRKLTALIITVLTVAASLITIFVFFTGRNVPDLLPDLKHPVTTDSTPEAVKPLTPEKDMSAERSGPAPSTPGAQKIEKLPGPFQAEKDINKKTEPAKTPTIFPEAMPPKVAIIKSREIDEKEKRLNEFKGLISTGVTTHPGKPNIALVIESQKTESGVSPENALYNLLRSQKMNIILNFFKEETFKSKGFFKEIYDGNTELLTQANALSKIDYLILGRLNYSFAKRGEENLISCDINFSYKVVGKKGDIVKSDIISIIGPGFSNDAALERGLEILAEKYTDRIFSSGL